MKTALGGLVRFLLQMDLHNPHRDMKPNFIQFHFPKPVIIFWFERQLQDFFGLKFNDVANKISHDMTKPTKWVCAQRRLRSAWASAKSDQSLCCPHEESLGPYLPIERTAKTLIRLGGCPGWPEFFAGCTLTLLVLSCRGSNVTLSLHFSPLHLKYRSSNG